MGAGNEQFGNGILILCGHAGAALATTVLRAECRQSGSFDVTAMGDGNDHFLPLHKVFVVQAIPACGDLT